MLLTILIASGSYIGSVLGIISRDTLTFVLVIVIIVSSVLNSIVLHRFTHKIWFTLTSKDPKKNLENVNLSYLETIEQLLHTERELHKQELSALRLELFKLNNTAFLHPSDHGTATYSKTLIELLKSGGFWIGKDILKSMDIPPKDYEAVAIVLNQLRMLKGYGLVEETTRGWRWVNDKKKKLDVVNTSPQ